MADVSKIVLPNGNEYNIKDAAARKDMPIIMKLTTAKKFAAATSVSDWTLSINDMTGTSVSAADAKACLDNGSPAYLRFEYQEPDTTSSYDDPTCYLLRWNYDDTNSRYYLRVDWQEAIVPKGSVGIGYYEIQIYYSSSAFVLGHFELANESFPNSDLVDLYQVPYDNTDSGLTATDAQAAIDEVASDVSSKSTVSVTQTVSTGTKIGTITVDGTGTDLYAPTGGSQTAAQTSYDNTSSGLVATNVQDAVDELNTSKAPSAITTTTTLASGDGIIFADNSDSGALKRSSITFDGSTTSKGLSQKGTWQSFAAGDHSHGAITNAGGITGSATAIGANDNIVFIDTSDSKKVKKSTITFDGSTTTQALTPKGTWETFATL